MTSKFYHRDSPNLSHAGMVVRDTIKVVLDLLDLCGDVYVVVQEPDWMAPFRRSIMDYVAPDGQVFVSVDNRFLHVWSLYKDKRKTLTGRVFLQSEHSFHTDRQKVWDKYNGVYVILVHTTATRGGTMFRVSPIFMERDKAHDSPTQKGFIDTGFVILHGGMIEIDTVGVAYHVEPLAK